MTDMAIQAVAEVFGTLVVQDVEGEKHLFVRRDDGTVLRVFEGDHIQVRDRSGRIIFDDIISDAALGHDKLKGVLTLKRKDGDTVFVPSEARASLIQTPC